MNTKSDQLKEKVESILNTRLRYFKNHLNCNNNSFNSAVYYNLKELCTILSKNIVEQYNYSPFRSSAKSVGIVIYSEAFNGNTDSVYEFELWLDIKVSNRNVKKEFGVEKLQYKLIYKNTEYIANDMDKFVELIRDIKM